ncbi:hypothetical protein D3C73_1202360 [compost metagenome]
MSIKKPNGNIANLAQGGVYTLVYDGSSAFILQGEGGEYGTATAAQVLAGYTYGTDTGLANGSMINQPGTGASPGASYGSGNLFEQIPFGGYLTSGSSGRPEVSLTTAQLQASTAYTAR